MPSRSRLPSKSTEKSAPTDGSDGQQRLQKVLAAAGLGSRRQCEELITTGRVEVDKQVVTALGTKVDPSRQEIRVDGTPLPKPKLQYYAVNKPMGVVSTSSDPAGRPRVIDLVPSGDRLFAVGRLDLSSEGLILVTNDGELANLLAHPRYGVEKTYHVLVAGNPEREVLDRLKQGVHLAEGFAHVARLSVKKQLANSTVLEMVLNEGKNREIRRLLAHVGHKVLRLKRIALGPLRLADLPSGEARPLRKEEIRALKHASRPGRKPNTGRPVTSENESIAGDSDGDELIQPGQATRPITGENHSRKTRSGSPIQVRRGLQRPSRPAGAPAAEHAATPTPRVMRPGPNKPGRSAGPRTKPGSRVYGRVNSTRDGQQRSSGHAAEPADGTSRKSFPKKRSGTGRPASAGTAPRKFTKATGLKKKVSSGQASPKKSFGHGKGAKPGPKTGHRRGTARVSPQGRGRGRQQ